VYLTGLYQLVVTDCMREMKEKAVVACMRVCTSVYRGYRKYKELRYLMQRLEDHYLTIFVPKVNVLIFLRTTWECSTSLTYIDELVMTLAVCAYLFKRDRLSLSSTIAVCVWSCFITPITFSMQPWYCSQRTFTCRTGS
jgi:hypothetical protein